MCWVAQQPLDYGNAAVVVHCHRRMRTWGQATGGCVASKTPKAAGEAREKDTIPAQFRVERRQLKVLREEAFRRSQERGAGRMDVSEVVREALDEWISKHGH